MVIIRLKHFDNFRNLMHIAQPYIRIARPDHWIKNAFILPGLALGLFLEYTSIAALVWPFLIGILSANAITSANYVINELLDAKFDKHHPSKRFRPAALGLISTKIAICEYFMLALTGLGLAYTVGILFLAVAGTLLLMGVLYNVRPFRLKDRPFLDILSESVNNPLRLLLGWGMVIVSGFPPSSVLLAYLFGGAFLMSVKRLAEYRRIGDAEAARQYRTSFGYYTEQLLLLSSFFYGSSSAFFLGIFLIKYRIELLFTFPLFSLLFTWYLAIGLRTDSVAQAPEHLYKEWKLLFFIVIIAGTVLALITVDFPSLELFLEPNVY